MYKNLKTTFLNQIKHKIKHELQISSLSTTDWKLENVSHNLGSGSSHTNDLDQE